MYPDTMRGFAPEVRGVASSNARVSIRQNNNEIYRTSVAAGPFVINDLYSLSSGGDLQVIVTEADGTEQTFTVPYSSVPILQRQGQVRYGITAGRYLSSSQYTSPAFAQGTLLRGLPHDITAYGGLQLAGKYRALAAGVGANLGRWGALSADITHADSILADGSHHVGQSVRFLYSRSLVSTGTTFQLAGYRYSTQGFHTLDETVLKGMSGWRYENGVVDAAGRRVERDWSGVYNLYNSRREQLRPRFPSRQESWGLSTLPGVIRPSGTAETQQIHFRPCSAAWRGRMPRQALPFSCLMARIPLFSPCRTAAHLRNITW